MKTYTINKPNGTIYSDFIFSNGNLYVIFELNNGRVNRLNVCSTEITNENWIIRDQFGKIQGFNGNVTENENNFIITLNTKHYENF